MKQDGGEDRLTHWNQQPLFLFFRSLVGFMSFVLFCIVKFCALESGSRATFSHLNISHVPSVDLKVSFSFAGRL